MSLEEKTRHLATAQGAERVQLLCDLSALLFREDIERGHAYASEAVVLAEALGDTVLLAESYRIMSQALLLQGELHEAIEVGRHALAQYTTTHNEWGRAKTLTLLGAIFRRQGAYDQSRTHHEQALVSASALADEELISRVHNNLGLVAWNMGLQAQALEHYQRTLSYWERQPGHTSERAYILTLNNVGILSNDQHEFGAALAFFERAIGLATAIGDTSAVINAHFNAGLAHEGLGCMESAIASYQRSYEAAESVGGKDAMGHACKVLTKVQMHREEWLEAEATARRGLALFEETGERRQSGQMTSLLSKILSHGGRREEALDFLERGLEMARDIESPEREMEVRSGRAELFAAMGDHERAYLELGLVRELEREVFALSKAEQIAQLESSHQSARKELEADFLRERAARLEEEVNARTRELREKHRQLQLAQHAKDCFLAMVGHELRTPLNTIIGFTEMAQEELLSLQGGAQAREDLGEVLSAGATLSDLIEKILELSSAASGETALQLSRVALPEFLENALQEHERLARLQGNQAHLEIALARPDIETDPERLRVLLRALLENAHKFTSAGVVCLRAHEEGESLHLTVTDTGVGMEPEMLRRVFEPFEQAELTSNRVMAGAGLGLTLVRHHAALLGGDLSVESVQGEGSSFRVTLPWRLT